MAKKKLSDAEAKAVLRKWPQRTKVVWSTPGRKGYWLRAQPKNLGSDRVTAPRIALPGATGSRTQPDGMWVYLRGETFADVVCIESCSDAQNLNDKRSRYSPRVGSIILHCPLPGLLEEISLNKSSKAPRWIACRSIDSKPKADVVLPIRFAQVLFALPNHEYPKWAASNVPDGHEYFCRHSSLDSWESQQMQNFLRQMSFASHFYTQVG